MELRINISKVHLFVFIGIIVLFGAVMVVIAQSPKNPGHPALQIESGTLSGDFSFNEPIAITPTNGKRSDFLSVKNTDQSQDHIAIISNKNDFGVWSTSLGGWANNIVGILYAQNVHTENIRGIPVADFCKKDGSGCPVRFGSKQIVATPGESRFTSKINFQPPCPSGNYVVELSTNWFSSPNNGDFSYIPFKGVALADNFDVLLVEISGRRAPTGPFDPVRIVLDYAVYC